MGLANCLDQQSPGNNITQTNSRHKINQNDVETFPTNSRKSESIKKNTKTDEMVEKLMRCLKQNVNDEEPSKPNKTRKKKPKKIEVKLCEF